jgi:hypothetical protein
LGATQKGVLTHLKEWQEAEEIGQATEAAQACAQEFNGLYADSAMNLLDRTPALLYLLAAYQAGLRDGLEEGRKIVQEVRTGSQGSMLDA